MIKFGDFFSNELNFFPDSDVHVEIQMCIYYYGPHLHLYVKSTRGYEEINHYYTARLQIGWS